MYRAFLMIMIVLAFTVGSYGVEARDKSGVLRASDLIGMKVEGTDGKNLGKILDLVIDPADASIDYAVLDFGGIVRIGDKYFAVPWDVLAWMEDRKKITLDVTKKDLKHAPGFDKNYWPDLTDRTQSVVIYEFYGVPVRSGESSSKGQ